MKDSADKAARIIADWRTGGYNARQLSYKHKCSLGFVGKHIKGVAKDREQLVNNGIAYKSKLAEIDEQDVHGAEAVQKVVDERTKHLLFFTNSALKNQQLSNARVFKKPDVTIHELEKHASITAKNKETALGKNPETAIQINHTEQPTIIRLLGPND